MNVLQANLKSGLLAILSPLVLLALAPTVEASVAYGTLNNFDCVNDTGVEAHGFEIELEDMHSSDCTYTYDYNHYGIPKITEDNSDPLHPRVFIRYAATRNPDGTWSAYTAVPSGPISPTDGHQFTNPAVNFGGEHFGVGYYGSPTAVRYNWLIDDGTGNLIHGPPVYIATPTFVYYPPAGGQPAQVQPVIEPPPAPPVFQFGVASWVKDIKTTTHNSNKVELVDLVDSDPNDPNAEDWTNGEPAEVETEWRILQTEFANADNPKGELAGAPQDLPDGDEVVTRRYEFYKYIGPIDAESGEAMADEVGPDGIHGVGTVTYNDHFDPFTGEWVEVTVDLSTVEVVGEFFGAQMSGFDVAPVIGLIDHLADGEVGVPYADRTVVVAGGAAFLATVTGALPDGTMFDELTGIFSGTPTTAGVFSFTVDASDISGAFVSKSYTVTIVAGAPLTSTIVTSALPAVGGTASGDGVYGNGTPISVIATQSMGYAFVNWTEGGVEVSPSQVYAFTVNTDRTLVANFVLVGCTGDADCDDGDACTSDVCAVGVCEYTQIGGCCNADSSCDDGNSCTQDACVNHACTHENVAGCCTTDAECADNDACTTDVCQSNVCGHSPIAGCCNADSSCDDGNSCTQDACVNHACTHENVAGCCTTDAECADDDDCTEDVCQSNVCGHSPIAGCCNADSSCDDGNSCTQDACVNHACTHENVVGCCTTDAECADDDDCTEDECEQGVCQHPASDDDGDGVCDEEDDCPQSDLTVTIIIDGCRTGVPNQMVEEGCTMSDEIAECAAEATTHNRFVRCVREHTQNWWEEGLINVIQRNRIRLCAVHADIP